jgi:hypothetical protein
MNGATGADRTRDIDHTKIVLCQLSYGGEKMEPVGVVDPPTCALRKRCSTLSYTGTKIEPAIRSRTPDLNCETLRHLLRNAGSPSRCSAQASEGWQCFALSVETTDAN